MLQDWHILFVLDLVMVLTVWIIFYNQKDGIIRIGILLMTGGKVLALALRIITTFMGLNSDLASQITIVPTLLGDAGFLVVTIAWLLKDKK